MNTAMKQFRCELCRELFERKCFASSKTPRFCSILCRNTANSRKKEIVLAKKCPDCGHVGRRQSVYCKACAGQPVISKDPISGKIQKRLSVIWTTEIDTFIREFYPENGALIVADKFNLPISSVRCRAARLQITLSDTGTKRIINGAAKSYMTTNNPMKRPEVRQKIHDWRESHPEIIESINAALTAGHARIEKKSPSGLERKLHAILDDIGIGYERSVIIKPHFIVDIRIGNLIIQADGDYWHGHPRFVTLTERQLKQQARDRSHDAYLIKCGYRIARIWESDMNIAEVAKILCENEIITKEVEKLFHLQRFATHTNT